MRTQSGRGGVFGKPSTAAVATKTLESDSDDSFESGDDGSEGNVTVRGIHRQVRPTVRPTARPHGRFQHPLQYPFIRDRLANTLTHSEVLSLNETAPGMVSGKKIKVARAARRKTYNEAATKIYRTNKSTLARPPSHLSTSVDRRVRLLLRVMTDDQLRGLPAQLIELFNDYRRNHTHTPQHPPLSLRLKKYIMEYPRHGFINFIHTYGINNQDLDDAHYLFKRMGYKNKKILTKYLNK